VPGSREAHNRQAVLGLGPTEEALSSDDIAAAAAKLGIAGTAAPHSASRVDRRSCCFGGTGSARTAASGHVACTEGDGSGNELRRGGRCSAAPRQHGSSCPAHWRHRRGAEGSARGVFAHRTQTHPRLFQAESSGGEAKAVRRRGSMATAVRLTGVFHAELKTVQYVCPSRTSTPSLVFSDLRSTHRPPEASSLLLVR
jgi:hypothetical protein